MRSNVAKVAAAAVTVLVLAGCGEASLAPKPAAPSSDERAPAQSAPAEGGTTTQHVERRNYVIPVATIQLAQPLARYTVYVNQMLDRLRSELTTLREAAVAGDLDRAEREWIPAHETWLDIGQDDAAYGAFGNLGQQIDGLAAGLPGTTANPEFTGFHRVEFDLWRDHNTTVASRDIQQLITFVDRLTPRAVAADMPLNTVSVDGWVLRCHEILEDGLRDSLSAQDDYGSNSDLASLGADVTATREMLHVLAPLIETRAATIVPEATVELEELEQTLGAAGGTHANTSLVALPARRRQAIDEATGAALETLAPVSEILQVVTPGS